MPSLSLAASSKDAFGWGSGAPVITSEGTTSGSALVWIIWSANRMGSGGQLRAYDPVPVNGAPVLRFAASIGTASNYSTPGVGAGKLFVGTREGKVLAFGAPVSPPLTGPAVSFPTTTIGSSKEKTLTLTAHQEVSLSGLASSSTQFTLGTPSPTIPVTLKDGQTISIPVTFTPTQTALVAAAVTATTSAGDQQFAVSGTGQSQGALLVASPRVVSFPGTAIGDHGSETATFSNGGSEALTINKVELPSAPFSTEGAPVAGAKIAPGGSITVTVAFDPTQTGTFKSMIGLQTTGGNAQIGLSGTAGALGDLQISNETNDYGSVLLGGTLTKSFTITNTGGTAVRIPKSKPPIGGEFTAETSLPEDTTIQIGESVTEQVTFAPTATGNANGEWQITGEDSSGPHKVQFTGTGIATAPVSLTSGTSSQNGTGAAPGQGILSFQEVHLRASPDARLAGAVFTETARGTVRVRVSCPAAEVMCMGTVTLQIGTGKPASGNRSAAQKTAVVTLATGSFTVRGGQVRSVTLRLTPKARALLARLRVITARATIAAHDPTGMAHTAHATIKIRSRNPRAR